MTNYLDREGIFKAEPVAWKVKTFPGKNSVAINVDLAIKAMLGENGEWQDWSSYDQVITSGDWFVLGKNGQPNQTAVDQLVESMGWDGSLRRVFGDPPKCIVQITVKNESYNGRDWFKATWMNPENFVPTAAGADEQEVGQLEARFGSLLRAAASAGAPAKKPPAPKKPAAPKAESKPAEKPVEDYGEIPFALLISAILSFGMLAL